MSELFEIGILMPSQLLGIALLEDLQSLPGSKCAFTKIDDADTDDLYAEGWSRSLCLRANDMVVVEFESLALPSMPFPFKSCQGYLFCNDPGHSRFELNMDFPKDDPRPYISAMRLDISALAAKYHALEYGFGLEGVLDTRQGEVYFFEKLLGSD